MSLDPGKPEAEIRRSADEDSLTAADNPIKALEALPEAEPSVESALAETSEKAEPSVEIAWLNQVKRLSLLLKSLWRNQVKRLVLKWSPVFQTNPLSQLAPPWRNRYLKEMPQERSSKWRVRQPRQRVPN